MSDQYLARVDWCDAYAYCKWAQKRLCGKIGGGPGSLDDNNSRQTSQWEQACSANGLNQFVIGLAGCGRQPLEPARQPGAGDADAAQPADRRDGTTGTDAAGGDGFLMIDDMEEHADGRPLAPAPSAFFWGAGGAVRIGNWFASWSDGSSGDAGIAVIDPPRGDSQRARRVVRGTFVQSASLWVELDHPLGRPVDLGAYAGITFWARLDGGGGKLVVAIESDPATGYFKARAANSQLPTQELAVAGEWQQVTLRFDEIGLRSTSVSSIDFVVAADTEPFTLWIDDLALFCRGACP